jgi:hypothetical protein
VWSGEGMGTDANFADSVDGNRPFVLPTVLSSPENAFSSGFDTLYLDQIASGNNFNVDYFGDGSVDLIVKLNGSSSAVADLKACVASL